MAKSQLTKGLVAGKTTGLLGAGMTTNPVADKSTSTQRAKANLANHATNGKFPGKVRSKVAQPASGATGRKLGDATKIQGGTY